MSAETQLYTLLSGNAGVIALVSTRIYPNLVPEEKTAPYIGYERVSTNPVGTLEGTILAEEAGIAVACWGKTPIQAAQVADAVLAALSGTAWRFEGRNSEVDDSTQRHADTLQLTLST
jgi:hypothetical protein